MKKKLFYYLFAVLCTATLFTSCSDDDDEVKYPIDTELAGGYVGNLSVNVDGKQMGTTENQKITISQSNKETNQIALSLKNFTFLVNVGDIEVDPCTVKAIDGGYAFEGQQNLDLVQPLGNCPVSISGTVKGSNINIEIGVKVGAPLNQNVKATFVGRKLTGSESSEAKIISFILDDDIVTEQPIINEEEGIVTFKVSDAAVDDDLSGMIPTIVVSSKAKITPASGVAQDFSNGKKVEYTVTAEDGTTKKYSVFIAGSSDYYSFETWKSLNDGAFEEPDGGWATSNTGVWFIKTVYPDVYNGDYPVVKSEDAKDGAVGVKLITLDTKGQAGADWGFIKIPAIPKVTSGSLFLGTFETDIQNTLNSTKFGNPYYSKPISVQFSYKYTPGAVYYTCPDPVKAEAVTEDPNTTDECSVTAVIYEVPYWETVDPDDANNKAVGVKLITLDTKGQAGADWGFIKIPAIPKVTSGSLFLGTFETDIQNTLNSTKFGNPYYSKPISVQFSYKYTPGAVYYTCPDPVKAEAVTEDPNTTDECSVTAVIYEVPYWETVDPDDANNKAYDKRLTGANLYTNTDQVIAMATFSSGVQEDYKDITLTLNYEKDYDPTKKYRFAIVFSSSKNGDKFSGAPGSTLIVDNVKVVAEK